MLQTNYDQLDYIRLKTNFNLNMVNFANLQTSFISQFPNELNKISVLTDKVSNLNIINGSCYRYKRGSQLKTISESNMVFDTNFNSFKLKPVISYKVEPKKYKNRILTEKKYRIYDEKKTQIRNLDDLLIKELPINLSTEENNYDYTLNINFNKVSSLNNIILKLSDITPSYPNISEIYYINNQRKKISVKILNNNTFSLDTDKYRNKDNIYSLDLETITADNVNIVFKDNIHDLIIDKLNFYYTEFEEEGEIVLEALRESKPILKVGIEGEGDIEYIDCFVSYNKRDWHRIDFSNLYGMNLNRVIAFNTISERSIKDSNDVKNLDIKFKFKSIKQSYKPNEKVNKETYRNSTFNVENIEFDEYSIYQNTDSIYYGQISTSNLFDFTSLFTQGEYVIIDNNYYIKGFVESNISKTYNSKYTYSPVSLKSREVPVNGENLVFKDIDISTKELYSFKIVESKNNLIDKDKVNYVIALKKDKIKNNYYISQENNSIPIDLSLGYINSALDVLVAVKPNIPVYLLDSFKNLIRELPVRSINGVSVVSLLDTDLFEIKESTSKYYPLVPLNDYEVGLLNNKLFSVNMDRNMTYDTIEKILIYTKDILSSKNENYSEIISTEDYNNSIISEEEVVRRGTKQIKLKNNNIIKSSVRITQ